MPDKNSTSIQVKRAKWPAEIASIRAIRDAVFIEEQAVPPDLEWDGLDAECVHVLARIQDLMVIGTGRLQQDGKIGRMAVLQHWRGQSVGGQILQALIEAAREISLNHVYLYAQTHAVSFYQRYGFVSYGDIFLEAGISHRAMRLDL